MTVSAASGVVAGPCQKLLDRLLHRDTSVATQHHFCARNSCQIGMIFRNFYAEVNLWRINSHHRDKTAWLNMPMVRRKGQ